MIYFLFIFIVSFLLMGIAAHWVVNSITFFAQIFKCREFVLVYFILVVGASIPNLSIGFFSTIRGVPDLFLGDVIGNALITMTLIIGLAAIISKGVYANSRVVQQSSFFLVIAALLPLLLIADGELSRGDGVVLISFFFFYSGWLFSKRKLFEHAYGEEEKDKVSFSHFGKNILKVLVGIFLLILAGNFIVESSSFFADHLNLEIAVFGIIFVALGTSLPELFFVITAAKKKNSWLILGAVIGDVIFLPTLGLGLIAIISPIKIPAFSNLSYLILFLAFTSFLFLFFIRSGKKISLKEAVVLLSLYFLFVAMELFFLISS